MKQTRFLQVLVMIALCGFGWALAQAVTVEAMKQLEQQWMDAYAEDDVEGIMTLYTWDAVWDEMDQLPAIGTDAIRAYFEGNEGMGVGAVTLETTEAVSFQDWGYTSGRWTYEDDEGGFSRGFYTHVFRMYAGKLLYHRDIFNRCNEVCPPLGFE
jgi:ketosteroid isomerase-like protein